MRVRLVAMCAVAVLVLAACGNSGDDDFDTSSPTDPSDTPVTTASDEDLDTNISSTQPGVSDTEIQVAVIASKTNPLNGKYAQVADGIRAYFEMVNSEGGIYGRNLVVSAERDDIVGLQNLQEVQASLADDNAFATFLASLGFTGADALDEAGQPTFIWNIRPEMAGHQNIFGNIGAICFGCTGQPLPWIAQEIGAEQVGVLAYGVANESKLCAAGNRDAFEQYPTAEVVFFDDTLEFAQPDLSAQVAEMKAKGVDLVTTCMDINEVIVLAREMKEQGLDAVQTLPNGYDAELVAANADLLNGSYVSVQFVPYENDPLPAEVETFLHWMEETGKEPIEIAAMGWILAYQFVEGLKLAGPEFTQQSVIDALNTQTDLDVNGMTVPLDWTKQHNDPVGNAEVDSDYECASIVEVVDGKFVPVFNEPGKPFSCWENNAEELNYLGNFSFEPGAEEGASNKNMRDQDTSETDTTEEPE
ncbi:MAG: ABC transporter substrate-binding protein [Actinomycetota bacterium]|nr:ABC transporter substrate-binding protein [Actinomycetota bacterium]